MRTFSDDQLLRDVRIPSPFVNDAPDFRLRLWDTFRVDSWGKSILGYDFSRNDVEIFQGEDFHCSPMDPIDSDAAIRSLLVFLTLRPGDTDREHFENYTTEQLDFADRYGEALSPSDEDGDPFVDW